MKCNYHSFKKLFLICLPTAMLIGCGDESDPDSNTVSDDAQLITKVGMIFFDQLQSTSFGSSTAAMGTFREVAGSFTEQAIVAELQSGQDTCVIDNGSDSDDGVPSFFGATIDAGEVVTITGSGGTVGEISKITFDDITGYMANVQLPYPLPLPLTLDIPGDQFPAFSGVSVPESGQMDLTPVQSVPINLDTQFTWTPTSDEFDRVDIDLVYTDISGTRVNIYCSPQDDGSFSLPQDVKDVIGNGDVVLTEYGRTTTARYRQADTLLIVENDNNITVN